MRHAILVLTIIGLAGQRAIAQATDSCAAAPPVQGFGVLPWNNTNATTDGSAGVGLCSSSGTGFIENDVWICWTSPRTTTVRLSTCSLTSVDTIIAVFQGCGCPSGTQFIACDDDSCAPQSELSFNATAGTRYLIRIGNFPFETPGSGQIEFFDAGGATPCVPDWNQDQTVGSPDLTGFVNAWFADLANGSIVTDIDQSGSIGSPDLTSFINQWLAALANGGQC